MAVVTRYLLWEIVKVFLLALTVQTCIFSLGGGVRQAREEGLTPLQIAEIMPFLLPEMLRLTIPGSLLFAVSVVYGRMSGSNEIVALKSLGISPVRVIWPVLWLALGLSLLTYSLFDVTAGWARPSLKRYVVRSIGEIAYNRLRAHRSFSSAQFSIIVKRVEGKKLLAPAISIVLGKQNRSVNIQAEEAELRTDVREGALTFICRRGTIDVEGEVQLKFDDSFEQDVPLDGSSESAGAMPRPSELPMEELPARIANQREEVHERVDELAAIQGITSPEELARRRDDLKYHRQYLARLLTEPQRRLANSFSCLCFVIVGVPVAIWRRNADFMSSFFVCFAPILSLYYPLMMVGENLCKDGTLPAVTVWAGNVLLAAIGSWLLERVIRY